ncbi:hypothetical protein K1719_016962 [Acacia pycnantha]|nr:hypothetical protein K1719_016962 [Acacia pycnantha]
MGEREKAKAKVSGGEEGSGGGEGKSDGGLDSNRSGQGPGGKGFSFGRMAGKGQSGEAGSKGSTDKARSGAPSLSYRDKLLSPGCAGFLVKHSEDDDIVQGWKDYFHKMNEKEPQIDSEDSEEEENTRTRKMEGKSGKLNFTAEEYTTWCMPWMNSLTIKILGANFPTYVIRDRINRMWRPKDPLKLIPLSNGYFIVSFSNKEDKEYAFQEGPWMIDDYYLIVQRWRPNFNPWKADLQCNIAAWVRLPDVPFEFYNVESLRRIGNMIGKMIKVDRSTSIYDKGGFARICVEIDLKKPLTPTYTVFGEERNIIYEGLHNVCFTCGKYGHQKRACPMTEEQKQVSGQDQSKPEVGSGSVDGMEKETIPDVGTDGGRQLDKEKKEGSTGGQKTEAKSGPGVGVSLVTGGDDSDGSPFGKIKILRRDFRGQSDQAILRKGFNENKDQDMRQNQLKDQRDIRLKNLNDQRGSRTVTGENEVASDLNKDKQELNIGKGPLIPEWVQVGAKRKNMGKGKAKGKENKPPAVRAYRKKSVGLGLEPTIANSFDVLHGLEAQQMGADVPFSKKPNDEIKTANQDGDTVMSTAGMNVSHTEGSLGALVDENQREVMDPAQHLCLDQNHVSQDSTLGEVAIPQQTPTVSQ